MQETVTLWQFIQAGGWAMLVLGILSVIALAIIVYDYMTIKAEQLVPVEFTEDLVRKLEGYQLQEARIICEKKSNIMAAIALTGLDRRAKGKVVMREAMENTARKEVGKLWQSIAYLGDIAVIAPLLGLLGTVLGMIQAFNVISYAGTSLTGRMKQRLIQRNYKNCLISPIQE
jgi:biopolymer transport protein ExbB